MYHPGTPYIPQVLPYCGFSCTNTFIPGDARGVLLKSNCPLIVVCVNIVGFLRQGLIIFKVTVACGISRHHRYIGKRVSVIFSPAMKFLYLHGEYVGAPTGIKYLLFGYISWCWLMPHYPDNGPMVCIFYWSGVTLAWCMIPVFGCRTYSWGVLV